MRRSQAIAIAVVCLLGWLCASLGARILDHYQTAGTLVSEWGRTRLVTLDPETERALAALEERVSATYYVSAREHMPSHMRRVERRVTDLLAALAHAAPGRFDYQIVDPETDPELTGFAANRRIAPFRERSIRGDAYSERTIWSALALSFGTRPAAVLNGITPDVLPRLQGAIVAHLEALDAPRRPRFALATSAARGFQDLAAALQERGDLLRLDLDGGDPLPREVDVLFWMTPRRVSADRLDELDRFLAGGSSLVVASSALAIDGQLLGGTDAESTALRVRPSGADTGLLWSHLGLRPRAGLYCDDRADEVLAGDAALRAPFAIRCIAPNQDFRGFGRQPNGTLLFSLATPLATDGPTLERRGSRATVLATTSETTWSLAPPFEEPLSLARMDAEREVRLPKQPLIVELRPADPWHGRVVALAATTPFEDGVLHRSFNAHTPLLETLLAGLASPDRLVQNDVPRAAAEALPKQGPQERLLWRALVVFALPALLLAAFLWTRRGRSQPAASKGANAPSDRISWRGAIAGFVTLIAGLAMTRALRETDARADWTAEGTNTLAPTTVALASRAGDGAPIDLLVALPEANGLPPEWKPGIRRLERLLRELKRAGAPLRVQRVNPEDEGDAGREAKGKLQQRGLRALEVASRAEEETTVRTLWSHVLLQRGEQVEEATFESEAAFEEAEFRMAFALWRLLEEREVAVAFASDLPRLSAAEAHEDYQQKGLFAPSGTDVYSRARALLEAQGYEVQHVDPRDPGDVGEAGIADDGGFAADLVVWMQPRRSIEPMLPLVARHLHGGGSLLLAAQHFNIQSRQYRGAGFELVYWPQPQSTDVERLYFPELGIELVREVLFDDLSTTIRTDTQITGRGAAKDFEEQTSALPFLLRVAAANMTDTPFTRGLGDQAFAWPSHLRIDAERLAEHGLQATPLLTTSPRSWTYAWSGGWLPQEMLAGPGTAPGTASGSPPASSSDSSDPTAQPTETPAPPGTADEGERPSYRGRLPLATLIEGSFPRPQGSLRLDGEPAPDEDARPWPAPAPGRLLVIGASHPFQDAQLSDEVFRSDQLLSNLVANLALPPDLAAVAARRQVPRGFDYVAPETKLVWRAAVVLGGPLTLCALALVWFLLRRRSGAAPHRGAPHRGAPA